VKLSPANIQIIGQELAIAWSDGQESYLPLEKLRRACPCASCTGEPDAMGRVHQPAVKYDPARSFQIVKFGMVGGYACQPSWADGHDTGLYAFDYIRRIAAES
jgi:DUF971 family protein